MRYLNTIPILASLFVVTQSPEPVLEYVAFRVDAERAIAVLKVLNDAETYRGPVQPDAGMVRFGFAPFDPPASWAKWIPSAPRPGDRWRIHVAPGRAIEATVEHIVGGQPQCEGIIGALLRVPGSEAEAYKAARARYFVARSTDTDVPHPDAAMLGFAAAANVDAGSRAAIDRLLNDVLRREHAKVRDERDAVAMRLSQSSSGRRAALRWKELDEVLARGGARLTYDLQTIRLRADAPPLNFVRAEWMVGGRQAFAAAVWIRGGETPEVVQVDTKPASWLRMGEFREKIWPSNLGLVLNVLDRDGDGWGEVLFLQEGYEGFGITLLEFSPTGFRPESVQYGTGC